MLRTCLPRVAQRFWVKAEKRPKQYIKQEKSTFAEKILELHHRPIFPILWGKYFFPSKTLSARQKPSYKTKKIIKKNNYGKARTTGPLCYAISAAILTTI
jgi:hypothetical protein